MLVKCPDGENIIYLNSFTPVPHFKHLIRITGQTGSGPAVVAVNDGRCGVNGLLTA